jgi:ABC-2 type transport system permease protein
MNSIAIRPSMPAIYARESWFAFIQVLREPAFALPTLLFPLAFYALFGLILPSKTGNTAPAHYLLATYGAFAAMGPALFGFGVGLAMEQQMGWLALKRASPMPIGAYFAAKVVMAMLFAFGTTLLLGSVAAIFGKVHLSLGQWLHLTTVLILGAIPFCAMGLLIGSVAKAQAAVAIVNLIYLPMSALSGLWIPVKMFPPIMQDLAPLLPDYHFGVLALDAAGFTVGNPGSALAAMIGFTVVFTGMALFAQRRRWSP